jgi:DNA-binding Xre family transcriptional regulator
VESSAWESTLIQSRQIRGEMKVMAVRLRVREVAKEKGISMGKLHRQADVSYKTIKRIYSDPFYTTTTITLGKLAKVLGVPPGDLIEEASDEDHEKNRDNKV